MIKPRARSPRRLARRRHPRRSALLFCLVAALAPVLATGQIFRYQDEQGVWHFTDAPPEGYETSIVPDISLSIERASTTVPIADLAARLEDAYAPDTPISYATLAVVSIKSDAVEGSGFFCSEEGHILTTRHVVRPESDEGLDGDGHEERQQQLAAVLADLKETRRRLEYMQTDLDHYEKLIAEARDDETRSWAADAKGRLLALYRAERARIAAMEESAEAVQQGVRQSRQEQGFQHGLAGSQQRFEVVLKDGTELVANLVAVSKDQDLALLKLEGYKTPALALDFSRSLSQGMRVFAIGNPLGMHDAVTSGVVTRITPDHLLTDAQILPGSSGGPLIRESGEVIGINVSRKVAAGTPMYAAGLGKAIPILVAMQSFPALLTASRSAPFAPPGGLPDGWYPDPEPMGTFTAEDAADPGRMGPAAGRVDRPTGARVQQGFDQGMGPDDPALDRPVGRWGAVGEAPSRGIGGDPPVRLILRDEEGGRGREEAADDGSGSLDFPPEGTSILSPRLSSPQE